MNSDALKRLAAARALDYVRPGMRLGLGTGSTAKHFVELLGERVRGGLKVIGVPTSEATRADAERVGVPLTNLEATPHLDVTVDGADEHLPEGNDRRVGAQVETYAPEKLVDAQVSTRVGRYAADGE